MKEEKISPEVLAESAEIQRIGNQAVHAAQEENRRLGLPNVYSDNGRLYYELPDGTITQQHPGERGAPESKHGSK